ncbi:hypothetical protein IM816_07100 [Luteibacter flocculans]|uniref:MAPEG family protein n=1 Tax=Luteibacter flocculans TaxID=2780091 RepID=A0ABY4T921_9GAMM|nr:hypothetical protein [Luteibacter flocculans]URL59850.1 hypothetical protein IM816_07100 [Luteibacter flocculans]
MKGNTINETAFGIETLTSYLLFGTIAATLLCLSFFVVRFLVGGVKYAPKGSTEYERLTMGNPLNALFIDRLLTNEGLALRRSMWRFIGAIWIACLILVSVIGVVWPKLA